jgi:hypothetical protein
MLQEEGLKKFNKFEVLWWRRFMLHEHDNYEYFHDL